MNGKLYAHGTFLCFQYVFEPNLAFSVPILLDVGMLLCTLTL